MKIQSTQRTPWTVGRFTGFGAGGTGAPAPIDIPRLSPAAPKNEDERRGAGAAPWMSRAVSPQVSRLAPGPLVEAGRAQRWLAWAAKAKAALSSDALMSIAVAAGLAASAIGIYDMGRRGGFGVSAQAARSAASIFGERRGDEPLLRDSLASANMGPSQSLSLARKANGGALGTTRTPVEAAQTGVSDEEFSETVPADDAAESAQGRIVEQVRQAAEGAAQQQQSRLANAMGNAALHGGGLSGGAGLSSGITRPLAPLALSDSQRGKLSSYDAGRKAGTERRKTPARTQAASLMDSRSAQKLQAMYGAMTGASGKDAQEQSYTHSAQWESAGETGEAITGAGASEIGGTGTGTDASASEEDGTTADASDGETAADETDDSAYDVEDTGETTNYTTYQDMVDMASLLLAAACVLLLAAYVFGLLAKSSSVYGAAFYAIAKFLAYAAMALAGMVTLLGIAIAATSDQTTQGAIFTGVGALLTALSYVAADGYAEAATAAPAAEAEAAAAGSEAAPQLAEDIVVLEV